MGNHGAAGGMSERRHSSCSSYDQRKTSIFPQFQKGSNILETIHVVNGFKHCMIFHVFAVWVILQFRHDLGVESCEKYTSVYFENAHCAKYTYIIDVACTFIQLPTGTYTNGELFNTSVSKNYVPSVTDQMATRTQI